jgi:hypothetical protein
MRPYLIFIIVIVIFLIGCTNIVNTNVDHQFSCKIDSDCVSATEIGCYTVNNGFAGYDICPAVNKDNFKPQCRETEVCRDPLKIICDNGMCKSIECETDSECVSATEVGCYVACNPEEGRVCSLIDLCPAVAKTFEPVCDKPFPCNEPSKIICENNQCKSIE